ncbi:hypothetical protein [Congregibacter sp.]|uniref:hypothetical protein n=1 Tax=Congregibacter sp. TaxID=2744308 RepID=UPI0039E6956D
MVERFNQPNSFNPSIAYRSSSCFMALRHFGPDSTPPFEASLLQYDIDSNVFVTVNLSHHAAEYGVSVVADPKLFEMNDEIWVTFNSGWARSSNSLYLMRVSPTLGHPIEVEYASRQRIEKNWAFFVHAGRLRAVYSITPFKQLSSDPPNNQSKKIVFNDDPGMTLANHNKPLAIGTQAIKIENDLFLIAHEKHSVLQYRAYAGRLVRLRLFDSRPQILVSERRLIHSYSALLGSFRKHNKNLLSCTYFSGLASLGNGRAVIGYGINDLSTGFAEAHIKDL